jgi:hypothetical protein
VQGSLASELSREDGRLNLNSGTIMGLACFRFGASFAGLACLAVFAGLNL